MKTTNPFTAAQEDVSIAYAMQLAAARGVNFQFNSKDFIAIDGNIEFYETPLRVQLKATTQTTYWNNTFSYYLEENWLRKWRGFCVPTVLILTTINPASGIAKSLGPMMHHNQDDFTADLRGYWIRVDGIAKDHDFSVQKGLSVTFNSTHRIDQNSIDTWHSIAMEPFTGGSV